MRLLFVILCASPAYAAPFHSYPGAPASVYLDMDGEPATTWDGSPVPAIPAYTGDRAEVFGRVAEKFAPFNVDVTDADPGNRDHLKTLHVVVGGNGSWYGSVAGVTTQDCFSFGLVDCRAYVFPLAWGNDPWLVGEVAAHEAAHAFGAGHQPNVNDPSQRYPVMAPMARKSRGVWFPDDMGVIGRTRNGFGYRTDEPTRPLGVSASGVIGEPTDRDAFTFSSDGPALLSLDVADVGATLDGTLSVLDSSGRQVSFADPDTLDAALSVPAGDWTVVVGSHGLYGDVGTYTLTVEAVTMEPVRVPEPGGVAVLAAGAMGLRRGRRPH